jgi:hypothetical protein
MSDHLPPPARLPEFSLSVDVWGRLVLTDDNGRQFAGVEPVRAFPLTEPRRWIALVDGDVHERALIEELDHLDPSLSEIVADELARREFVPVIERIERVDGEPPVCFWSVVTDRGAVAFTVEGEDQVRRIGPNRVVIVDQLGQRYLIPDMTLLDSSSQKRLGLFL